MEAKIMDARRFIAEGTPGVKTVIMPTVQSMMSYLLRHYKRKILNALNRSVVAGKLDSAFGFDIADRRFNASSCKIRDMDYWRVDMYNALIDIKMTLSVDLGNTIVVANAYGELWLEAESGFNIRFGKFGPLEELPERDFIRLSTYLVPYLDKADLEKEMDLLRATYDCTDMETSALQRAQRLAAAMGLKVVAHPLYKKDGTESILYFRKSEILTLEKAGYGKTEPRLETVEANTIVLNMNALHKDQCAMPIFHECVHYHLHFLFYRLQQMYNDNDIARLGRKRIVVKDGKIPKNPIRWMEWQAQRGAYALMMPYDFMKAEMSERLANCCVSYHKGARMDVVGRGIAGDYEIPKFRVRARMIQLGNIHAYGALNYVDGKYIEPFDFSSENFEWDHTFVIDKAGIKEAYETDENFRDRLDSGYYVYVDGHIVINDPQYVRQIWSGLQLTALANSHVDMCCLRFLHIYEADEPEECEYYYGALNSDEEYNRDYFAFVDDGGMDATEKYRAMGKLIMQMPRTFNAALTYLMEKSGNTEETLAEAMGVSTKTIDRRRNDTSTPYKAEQIVPLCLALHLPPIVSNYLMSLANVSLNMMNKQHQGYRILLDCMYMDSMEDIQKSLRTMGYKQFNNTYKTA